MAVTLADAGPVQSFVNRLRSTAQVAVDEGIKVCIYGKAGSGKTRLIATAPKPIVLSAEKGTLSLRGYNIPCLPEIKSVADFKAQKRWALESREALQFYTICLDSVSEIADAILLDEKNKSRDGRAAYGAMNDEMTSIINDFRNSNRTVYFVAREVFEKDETTGAMSFVPDFPGKTLTARFPYKFDELLRLEMFTDMNGVTTTALRCHPTATVTAKDRSGALALYEPPNLEAIFRKILQL